ncbi:hypothetical protein EON64_11600, partial [archaeon]
MYERGRNIRSHQLRMATTCRAAPPLHIAKMEFGDNESVLFQYAASYQKKDGNLYVTSLRIFFIPNSSPESQSFTWANVKTIAFSPANDPQQRAAIRLVSVIDEKAHTILLINADVKAKFAALEKVKGLVSELRKSSSPPDPASSNAPSLVNLTLTNNARGLINDMSSNLLSLVTEVDGRKKIHLTPEVKVLVFRRFPAVQRAFSQEVPFKMSEQQFWEAFFQSQYFARPQDNNINMT